MQTNISITFRFDEIRLLGFRVPGLGLGSVLPVVPHQFKNLVLRSVSTFFVSPPRGILDSTLHRHPTHILSPNLCHRMCPWHRKITEIDVYTPGLEIGHLLFCQLVSNFFNHCGFGDSTLHRYPTRIKSPNHCHRMCLGQGIDTGKSLKLTLVDTGSRFHCFYPVNLC